MKTENAPTSAPVDRLVGPVAVSDLQLKFDRLFDVTKRIERGMKWVIQKLRTHHSSRPGINAICDRAEECLRGFEIVDK